MKFLPLAALTGILGAADPATVYHKEIVPLLEMYCYSCHGEE